MAISLPDVPFRASYPEIVDGVSVSRAGRRIVSIVEYADPFWQVTMRTKPLRARQRLAVESFIDRARAGMETIHYSPKHQCLPSAYWGNPGAPELANGSMSGKSGYGTTISASNGLVLSPGDLISFTTGQHNWMARVASGGTVSGGSMTIVLGVPVPPYITAGAVVRFRNIIANMRLLPGSFSLQGEVLPAAEFTLFEVPR